MHDNWSGNYQALDRYQMILSFDILSYCLCPKSLFLTFDRRLTLLPSRYSHPESLFFSIGLTRWLYVPSECSRRPETGRNRGSVGTRYRWILLVFSPDVSGRWLGLSRPWEQRSLEWTSESGKSVGRWQLLRCRLLRLYLRCIRWGLLGRSRLIVVLAWNSKTLLLLLSWWV